uniref:Uncharacterized protein n=1 Tax=Arundo donax TaxID=35708 RepID=A0A0A9AL38_ARUDO
MQDHLLVKLFVTSGRAWRFVSQATDTVLDPWILLIIIVSE